MHHVHLVESQVFEGQYLYYWDLNSNHQIPLHALESAYLISAASQQYHALLLVSHSYVRLTERPLFREKLLMLD